jgi:exopolysaccharide production protein ExoY
MSEHMRISDERNCEIVESKPEPFDSAAERQRVHGAGPPPLLFAANDISDSEAALIVAAATAGQHQGQRPGAARKPAFASRVLDVVVAATLCLVLLPVLAGITLYLKLLERGPLFFAHRRVGLDGKPFGCLKFRTMCVDADQRLAQLLATDPALRQEWTSTQKLLCDPRVTRFGNVLRNTSLDELPQLLNVLRGEMSLVGPRPIVEDELRRYGRFAAHYKSVRPGLTGLWQVTRNSRTTYRRRVATDVHYVRNRTLALDLKILFATIPAVLADNG